MKQDEANDGLQKESIITDSRFSRLHSDPRFQRIPRNHSKVPIDSRFQHMFSDKNFSESLALDKRGKPKKKKQANLLHQYYYQDNPQELEDNADNRVEEIDEVGLLPSHADGNAKIDKKNKNKMKSIGKSDEMSMGFSDDVGRDEYVHQYYQEALEEGKLGFVGSAVDAAKTKNKKKKKKKKKSQDIQGVLEEDRLDVVTSSVDPAQTKDEKKKKKNAQEAFEEDKLDVVISVVDLAKKKKKKKKKNDAGLGDLDDNMCIDKGSDDNQRVELNSVKKKEEEENGGLGDLVDNMCIDKGSEDNQGVELKSAKKKKKTKKKEEEEEENGGLGDLEGNMCIDKGSEDNQGVELKSAKKKKTKKKEEENGGLGDLEDNMCIDKGSEDNQGVELNSSKKKKKEEEENGGLGNLEGNMCIDKGGEDNQGVELNSAKKKHKKKKMKMGSALWEETMHVEEDDEDNRGIQSSQGQLEEVRLQMKQEANSNVGSRSNKKKDGRRLKSSGKEMRDKDELNIAKELQWPRTSEDSKKSERKEDSIFGAAKKANATVEKFQEEEFENQDDQEANALMSSSDEYVDVSESETSSTSDEDDRIEPESPKQDEVPTVDRATQRLAVVNMDWNHIKAVDLLVLLNSFLPKGGHILSVAVYPSDFGLKQMAEEAVKGPIAIFESDDESGEDDQSESNNEKLRQYEKARLRYYYAVVLCDSCTTSDYLYKACDGLEYERTSNVVDLRFIPDDMKFDQPPRDVATEIPADYQAPDFHTRALQHSNVKLEWDDDEPLRVKTLNRTFKPDQLNEMDFKAYLASDDDVENNESDDNDGQEDTQVGETMEKGLREKYRSVLLESGDPSEGEEDKTDKDMEITFNTGLEELSKRILEKNQKANTEETVWEAYLRKRREKKKAKKNRCKGLSEDEVNSSDKDDAKNDEEGNKSDDFFLDDEPSNIKEKSGKGIDDTYVKKATVSSGSAGKKGKKLKKRTVEARGEEDASKAELELLIADDHGLENDVRGYNLKFRKSKGQKWEELPNEDKLPTVDYDDPRFSALFTSHHFAIDPTDPQYKRSAAYGRSLAQKQQKKFSEETVDDWKPVVHKELVSDEPSSKKRKAELSSLIRSVKRKVGTVDS